MLDLALLRADPEAVTAGIARKGADPALVRRALDVDGRLRGIRALTEAAQARQNAASKEMASASPERREALRGGLKELSDEVRDGECAVALLEAELLVLRRQIPNLPAAEVPDGRSDADNLVIREEGERPRFDFAPRPHDVLARNLRLLDQERGAKVAGSKSYYLTGDLVLLEQAVLRFGLDRARAAGFLPLTVPNFARAEAFYGAGHFASPDDAADGDAYRLERDELYLAGTAEIGLINYRAGETVAESELPLRYCAVSTSYRREAGTYGKEGRGLYRVHQFQKAEMVSIVRPEDAGAEHERLLAVSEGILRELGLSYRVVLNCAGDLGHPQAKKWDLEAWLPGMGKYGETHSCSNDTDWQARSLGIRAKGAAGTYYPHTLNDTVIASPRILVALLENGQRADGSVALPEALAPYCGFAELR